MVFFWTNVSIFLFIIVSIISIKIGKYIASKIVYNAKKKEQILIEIERALQSAIDIINIYNITDEEIKKLKIQKSKFLNKVHKIVCEISKATGIQTSEKSFDDKILGENITINLLSTLPNPQDISQYNDYQFILKTITDVIVNNNFPTEDDYIKLNAIYKKFKKLNKINV